MSEGLKTSICLLVIASVYLAIGATALSIWFSTATSHFEKCGKVETTILYIIKTDLFCE
jgi:hypothetical protein